MKKITAVFALTLCILMLFCSCSQKAVVTAETFKSSLEAQNFTVKDVTQFYSAKDTCEKVYKASPEGNKYSLIFYQFTTDASAKNEYLYLINEYKDGKESSGNNFDKLVFENAGTYISIVRVNNTLLSTTIPKLYYDEALAIITQLGY